MALFEQGEHRILGQHILVEQGVLDRLDHLFIVADGAKRIAVELVRFFFDLANRVLAAALVLELRVIDLGARVHRQAIDHQIEHPGGLFDIVLAAHRNAPCAVKQLFRGNPAVQLDDVLLELFERAQRDVVAGTQHITQRAQLGHRFGADF